MKKVTEVVAALLVLQLHSEMICADRSTNGRPHPPGYRANVDVCELFHPVSDERGR